MLTKESDFPLFIQVSVCKQGVEDPQLNASEASDFVGTEATEDSEDMDAVPIRSDAVQLSRLNNTFEVVFKPVQERGTALSSVALPVLEPVPG